MQTNQENRSALERQVEMTVAMAEIEKDVESRLKKLSKTVKMAGFRPGKVPMKLVAQTYGPQVRSEAIGAAVERELGEKIREGNFRVAGSPRIEPRESAAGALSFAATFEVYPDVVVGDLSGRQIERPELALGDAEVDRTIDVLRKQRTIFVEADRAAVDGDRVTVDFTGRKDGEVFEGGQAIDFPFVLGAGSMLQDFETAAIGLAVGQNRAFDLSFPEDYHAKDLAGQTVQFEIVMKRVEEPKLPELDEEFAKSLGVADGNLVTMRDEVRANLEREVKRRVQAKIKEQVMEALIAVTPIEVPSTLVNAEAEQLANNARQELESRGTMANNMPIQPAWFAENAQRRVKLGLIMAEVVRANGLYAKPEQIRALVEEFAQSYEDPAEVVTWYYTQPQRMQQAEALVIEENVVQWVLAQAETSTKAVAFDELMGNAA